VKIRLQFIGRKKRPINKTLKLYPKYNQKDQNSQTSETPHNIVGRILEIRGKSMASTKSEVAGGWVGVITGARRLG